MRRKMESVLREIEKAVVGKEAVIVKILTAILADGHILMDDVPGVGKTTLAVALSRAVELNYHRVQFTPDVLPSDLVGFTMYEKESGTFIYRPGVINGANLLLGDEINRTSSKTQSALLEAMEEKQITVDGQTYPLPDPFIVIATQNSVGAAGTQALPYAQMDRFLVRLSLGYPDHAAQIAMLRERRTGNPLDQVERTLKKEDLLLMRRETANVTVKDTIYGYISDLSIRSRQDPRIEIGVSPRGALFLARMAQAHAYMEDRDYVTGEDVQSVFHDVCGHRVILSRQGRMDGLNVHAALDAVLDAVPVPDRGS